MPTKTSYTEIFLKVLAWLGIVGGAFGLFGGVVFGLMALFVPFDQLYANLPNAAPGLGEHMAKLMRFEAVMMLLALPMDLAGVIGGVGVLRQRAWGRATLEGAVWAYLAFLVCSATYMAFLMDTSLFLPPAAAGVDPAVQARTAEFMDVAIKVVSAVMSILCGGVAATVLWFLRRQATRDWFGRA